MPPAAMASSVVVTAIRARSLPRAAAASSASWAIGCGNFGAPPSPPHTGSEAPSRAPTA